MAGQISLDIARKQGACIPCSEHRVEPVAVRPTITRESAFTQRTVRVPVALLGLGQSAFLDIALFPSGNGSDHVLPVCDGLQVIETYAVSDAAEMVKLRGEGTTAGFPNKTMGQTVFTTISGTAVTINGINVSSPKQAWSEFRRIFRNVTDNSMISNILGQSSTSANGIDSTSIPLLVVTTTESDSRVLDLAFAMGLFADSPGKSARYTYWLQGRRSRIPVDFETTIMTAAKFLGQNGESAVLYCTDNGSEFAATALGITGNTPTFVMCTAPSSGPSFLTTGGYQAEQRFAPLTTHDGPGWITNPRATRRIRAYWKRGKGAAKIRWFTKGAMRRCIRHLRKYFPENAGGLCANMHKEVTGEWPRGGVIPS